jgi:hypothetical protein
MHVALVAEGESANDNCTDALFAQQNKCQFGMDSTNNECLVISAVQLNGFL